MKKIGDILKIVERVIPQALVRDWDNSGLQVGSLEWPAEGIIISLDADVSLLEKAKELGANIAITHHPLLFNPVKKLDLDTPVGKVLEMAVRDRIAVYSAHTNLDAMEGGVNDTLADRMNLLNIRPLADIGRIGDLASEETIDNLASRIKADFSIPYVSIVGRPERMVKRVAVCGGSGSSLIMDAAESGADLFITGDVKYHAARDAEACGLAVMDIGHFASESIILPVAASLIKKELEKEGIEIGLHIYQGNDPLNVH